VLPTLGEVGLSTYVNALRRWADRSALPPPYVIGRGPHQTAGRPMLEAHPSPTSMFFLVLAPQPQYILATLIGKNRIKFHCYVCVHELPTQSN
jgi:hypothetical protein